MQWKCLHSNDPVGQPTLHEGDCAVALWVNLHPEETRNITLDLQVHLPVDSEFVDQLINVLLLPGEELGIINIDQTNHFVPNEQQRPTSGLDSNPTTAPAQPRMHRGRPGCDEPYLLDHILVPVVMTQSDPRRSRTRSQGIATLGSLSIKPHFLRFAFDAGRIPLQILQTIVPFLVFPSISHPFGSSRQFCCLAARPWSSRFCALAPFGPGPTPINQNRESVPTPRKTEAG
jgi:hypothetical protein